MKMNLTNYFMVTYYVSMNMSEAIKIANISWNNQENPFISTYSTNVCSIVKIFLIENSNPNNYVS